MDDTQKPNDTWAEKWNERYRNEAFAYGEEPNEYCKDQLDKMPVGTILFPAEGEGRNAVYAAKQGWKVVAFDISHEGQRKALQLAEKNKVTINYQVGRLETLHFAEAPFDAMALIYAHFPADVKSLYHQTLDQYLKLNGTIIFEAFSKKHLDYKLANNKVGGPNDIASLFSIDEIKSDFPNYAFSMLEETEVQLSEGVFHNGTGSVIRFVARKTSKR